MKICIVSDSHDRAELLAAAANQAKSDGAQAVIHCGDLIGANTLRASLKVGFSLHVVHGNNLGDAGGVLFAIDVGGLWRKFETGWFGRPRHSAGKTAADL